MLWNIPYWDTDPKVNSHWAPKGHENDEAAEYIILTEKKKDEVDGTSYYKYSYGRSGRPGNGWLALGYLTKNYFPWNDPWAKVKQKAKEWGFTFKEKI